MPDSLRRPAAGSAPDSAGIPRVVVLGIGNSLLADDGAGVQAIRVLQEQASAAGIDWLDAGTLNFSLLGYLDGAKALIVIDAAELGLSPGAVRVHEGEDMDRAVGASKSNSVHEAGLADLLAMARAMDWLPVRRALICVQPERIDWGEELSVPVARALPEICARARQLASRWSG